MAVEGPSVGGSQYETDRARFLGRGRGIRTPMSVIDGRPLSNTTGAVLDPIFSLRRRVRLAPGGERARRVLDRCVAATRAAALGLADKYRDPATFERIATLAWTQAQVQLHHLGITRGGGAPLPAARQPHPLRRPAAARARRRSSRATRSGPPALWAHRISGDLPIVLVRIDEVEDREIVRQLLRAHEYWRMKGLAVDLVILNEKPPSYLQDLQDALEGLVRAGRAHAGRDAAGVGLRAARRPARRPTSATASLAAARVVLLSRQGTLAEQVARAERPRRAPRRREPARAGRLADAGPSRRRPRRRASSTTGSAASRRTAAST